jgi:hypothetical protein
VTVKTGRFSMPGGRGMPQSAVGVAASSAAEKTPSTIAASLGARVHIDVTIPRTDVRGRMRLCSRVEEFEAKAAARQVMLDAGYPVDGDAHAALGATEQWAAEIMAHMLHKAVRDPANVELELAPIEDWRDLDDMQLIGLWNQYNDLGARLDPVGFGELPQAQLDAIVHASKKKDVDLLMSYGSRSLALFAISSVAQPAISETPRSSSGSTPT